MRDQARHGQDYESTVIRETTVGILAGVRVGCGNLWERAYRHADGREVTGMSAQLAPFDTEVAIFVGAGSEFEVGGQKWRVTEVAKHAGELGYVRLERCAAGKAENAS